MRMLALLALVGCASGTRTTIVGDSTVHTLKVHYNNAHLVHTAGGPILVDAGLERDGEELVHALREVGTAPEDLGLVVVTHGHADHAGGAGWLRQQFGTPVLVGAGDLDLLASGQNDRLCPTDRTARRRLDDAQAERFTPFEPDHVVDAEPFDLDALGLEGVVTPVAGHTSGSLVLQVGEALFVGDLLRGGITSSSAHTHFYQCDLSDNQADVADVHDRVAPEATHWFVGHFGPLERTAVTNWLEEARHDH